MFLCFVSANYTIIPVNNTPEINPGNTIAIDLYLSGGGVPDESVMYINYNKSLVDIDSPGKISAFVGQGLDQETEELIPISGDEYEQSQPIKLPATLVELPKTMYYPEPPEEPGVITAPLASESDHETHSPLEIQINTAKCPPGDYYITIVLNYISGEEVLQDRQESKVHIRTWRERNRNKIEIAGIIGVIASIGLLLLSSGILPL